MVATSFSGCTDQWRQQSGKDGERPKVVSALQPDIEVGHYTSHTGLCVFVCVCVCVCVLGSLGNSKCNEVGRQISGSC